MSTTLIRIDQLRKPDDFTDTLSASAVAAIESTAVDHADFWTGILSQVKRVIHGDSAGNWHDNPEAVFGGDATLQGLYNRATLEGKLALVLRENMNDITVTAAQNWMALTGSTKPDKNIAISVSLDGAVTAKLAGAIGSHSLTQIDGSNALRPKNFCYVFDGDTGDPILSDGRRVAALLQVGNLATDGNPFGDSGNDQGQLSFVRANATFDDLEACPVADIAGKKIIYAFSWRENLADLPEEFFRGDIESADPQAGVTVSLDSAYDGGYYMTVDGNDVDIRLADTKAWVFRNGSGGSVIWKLTRNDTTGDTMVMTVDGLDVNTTTVPDFNMGIAVATGGQTINVGVTASGVIDSAASIELRATAGDATVKSVGAGGDTFIRSEDGEVYFETVRETTPIQLDDATAGKISTLFSQSFTSISAAIKYAGEHGGVDLSLKVFVAGSNYGQGVNVPAAVQDITAYPIDMNTPANTKQIVFLNGRLLYGGNGTTKNDVYAGTTPASGDIMVDFAKGIKTGDVIISAVLAE